MDSTAMLLKVAYAEGVKRALLENGVDEMTALTQSEAFTNEKLSGIKEVASMVGRGAKAVGQGVQRAGKDVTRKASQIKDYFGVPKEFVPLKYRKLRNIGIGAAGATAVGAGALGVHAAQKKKKSRRPDGPN